MKSVTLSASGLKFPAAFTTVVTKVNSPDKDSSIVLESAPHVEISLGAETATSLGIEKGSRISIKPITGDKDNSFTLEVGEKEKPKAAAPVASRSGGCSSAYNTYSGL